MTKKKTFEVEKNGYRMFIVEDSESNFKTIDIRQDTGYSPTLHIGNPPSQMHSIMKDNSFEKLEIEIETRSIGSKPVKRIKTMIQQYENAIETVDYFMSELMKLKG